MVCLFGLLISIVLTSKCQIPSSEFALSGFAWSIFALFGFVFSGFVVSGFALSGFVFTSVLIAFTRTGVESELSIAFLAASAAAFPSGLNGFEGRWDGIGDVTGDCIGVSNCSETNYRNKLLRS